MAVLRKTPNSAREPNYQSYAIPSSRHNFLVECFHIYLCIQYESDSLNKHFERIIWSNRFLYTAPIAVMI